MVSTVTGLEPHVGEPGVHAGDVRGELVARERPAGGRVLVGPVVGQRRHHLPGLVAVPRVEVPVQGRVDAHAHTFALRPGRINYDLSGP